MPPPAVHRKASKPDVELLEPTTTEPSTLTPSAPPENCPPGRSPRPTMPPPAVQRKASEYEVEVLVPTTTAPLPLTASGYKNGVGGGADGSGGGKKGRPSTPARAGCAVRTISQTVRSAMRRKCGDSMCFRSF